MFFAEEKENIQWTKGKPRLARGLKAAASREEENGPGSGRKCDQVAARSEGSTGLLAPEHRRGSDRVSQVVVAGG